MAERSNRHDEFFKYALGRPETARDFLSHYLPAEVAAQLDLATVALAPGSFVDARLRAHLSDLYHPGEGRATGPQDRAYAQRSTACLRMVVLDSR